MGILIIKTFAKVTIIISKSMSEPSPAPDNHYNHNDHHDFHDDHDLHGHDDHHDQDGVLFSPFPRRPLSSSFHSKTTLAPSCPGHLDDDQDVDDVRDDDNDDDDYSADDYHNDDHVDDEKAPDSSWSNRADNDANDCNGGGDYDYDDYDEITDK